MVEIGPGVDDGPTATSATESLSHRHVLQVDLHLRLLATCKDGMNPSKEYRRSETKEEKENSNPESSDSLLMGSFWTPPSHAAIPVSDHQYRREGGGAPVAPERLCLT